jgi:hypothetical protein
MRPAKAHTGLAIAPRGVHFTANLVLRTPEFYVQNVTLRKDVRFVLTGVRRR